MQKSDKTHKGPYDQNYAALYNKLWWESDTWAPEGKFHIQTISELLKQEGTWLDAGSGNGYFLSHFPKVKRSGLDLSEAMIAEAKKVNPDVNFYHQNLIDENPSLTGAFDLVTCTGQAWCYFDTLSEVEKVVENLSNWTSDDGKCMLVPLDISDLTPVNLPQFMRMDDVPNNYGLITGAFWTYKELDTIHHKCLSPMLDQWIRWFSRYFLKVEIIRWPHEPKILTIPRRVLVCSIKRKEGDLSPTEIIEHPIPEGNLPTSRGPAEHLGHKQLLSELTYRLKSGELIRALWNKILYRLKR